MNIPLSRVISPRRFSRDAEKGERVDPYAFSEVERVLWKASTSRTTPTVFRKACLTGFEGIKG